MNPADFDMDTAGFECRRCGNCCRWPGAVKLLDEEVDAIYSESFATDGIGQAIMNRLLKAAGHKYKNIREDE